MKIRTAPLPNKTELFCSGCQKWRPRNQIVAVNWMRNGKQPRRDGR